MSVEILARRRSRLFAVEAAGGDPSESRIRKHEAEGLHTGIRGHHRWTVRQSSKAQMEHRADALGRVETGGAVDP